MYLFHLCCIRILHLCLTDLNHPHHKTQEELRQELLQIEEAKQNLARFSVLYEKYFRSIFVFVYHRTQQEELTADITQVVFMKAIANLQRYTFKGVPFSSWLFSIAVNEVNMYFRKTKRERAVSLQHEDLGRIIEEMDDGDSQEKEKLLLKAMEKLKEDEVEIIQLRFFEKRSFAEVGEILGITENNAKVRTYRVLDKLKVFMSPKK